MKNLISSLILTLAILVCACGASSEPVEGEYTLYYTNETASTLVPYSYVSANTEALLLVKEFYEQMANVSETNSVSVIPSEINLEKSELIDDTLDLHVDGDVLSLTKPERLVYFAALTKVMTSIDGISGVRVLYKDEVVTDGTESETGIMRASTFVDNVSENADDYITSEINLYFADEDKDSLVKKTETVSYRSTTQLEKVVIEKLIEGPEDDSCNSALPKSLTVLSVSTRDGVCYVNLDDKLITDPVTGYDQVPVYSITNTLTALPDIDAVQISVNGSKDVKMPMGTVSLSSPFYFNEEIVTR